MEYVKCIKQQSSKDFKFVLSLDQVIGVCSQRDRLDIQDVSTLWYLPRPFYYYTLNFHNVIYSDNQTTSLRQSA